MLVPFVDISHYQGNVDFRKMAATGVKAVLAKVSEGGAADPKWPQYAHDARAAGLAIGGYCFVQCASSLGAEGSADFFVEHLQAVGGPLMLHMYDMEWSGAGTLSQADRAGYYTRLVNRADSQLGRKGSIYSVKSFWRDYTGNSPVLADHDLIVATARGGTPPTNAADWDDWFDATGGVMTPKYYPIVPWTDWAACQFSVANVGPTYGVQSTAIDMDVCKPDVYARWTGQTPPPEDDMGQPFALISGGGVTYAVAADLQSKLALNASTLKAAQALLTLAGFSTTVIAATGDILNLLNGIPLTTDDATAAQVGGLGTQLSTLSAAVGAGFTNTGTHLNQQDTTLGGIKTDVATVNGNVLKIPTTPGSGGQDLTRVHLDSIPGHLQVDP